VSTLNKLIRLHSRKAIITFLNSIDPLPLELLHSLPELQKMILISFNEALQIRKLTGNALVLKQVKMFMSRLAKEISMRDFFNDFLQTYIIQGTQTMVKKMIEDKNFLSKESFDSEVDASIYPSPYLIITLIKLLINHAPEVLLEQRGVAPNLVSALLSIAIGSTIKNPQSPLLPTKLLESAVKIFQLINKEQEFYNYLGDVASHTLLFRIREKVGKLSRTKKANLIKLLQEIYYYLTKIDISY
jgi:hypothetical protein